MIDFMIIGLPRSGTTWAANWLTTERLHCRHDPLYMLHYSELDGAAVSGKLNGVSCTGLWRFPDFLSKHPARKVILHRSLPEINASMAAIGLPPCTPDDVRALNSVVGEHYDFSDLFDTACASGIWRYLTGYGMDLDRHAELVQIEMQPKFSGLKVGAEVTRSLVAELQRALR
jgi:hypothetical protein